MFNPDQLNAWAESWASLVWRSTVDSTLALGLVGMVWLVFRKHLSVQAGYVLFLLVFLKLLVPGFVSLPGLIHPWLPVQRIGTGISGEDWGWWRSGRPAGVGNNPTTGDMDAAPAIGENLTGSTELSGTFWLMLVWWLITGFLCLRFWGHQRTIRRRFRQTQPVKKKKLRAELDELAQRSGLHRPVVWVTADWAGSPVVWGLVRPWIVIPRDFDRCFSREQRRWIVLHELAHVRRGDLFVRLVQSLLQIAFFFNPVVRAVNRTVDRLREYACDDAAIVDSGVPRKECGEGLLGIAAQAASGPAFLPFSLGLSTNKDFLKHRITRILDARRILAREVTRKSRLYLLAFSAGLIPLSGILALTPSYQWTRIETLDSPVQRQGYAMAYDSDRGKVVMFGGFNSNFRYMLNETWEWDGKEWSEIPIDPASRPEPRFLMSMVYDSARKRMVMYGGGDVVQWRGYEDTWEYDGTTWTQRNVKGPGIRGGYAMAYDESRGKTVLYGGMDLDLKPIAGLWEWDGNQWLRVVVQESPSPRCYIFSAYDSRRQKMVLFGGTDHNKMFGDTWEWDGITFSKVSESGPEPRIWGSMAYDKSSGRMILFGGGTDLIDSDPKRSLGDTWEWDGRSWTLINDIALLPREMITMTYDARRRKMVWFGGISKETGESVGFNDTYVLSNVNSGKIVMTPQ